LVFAKLQADISRITSSLPSQQQPQPDDAAVSLPHRAPVATPIIAGNRSPSATKQQQQQHATRPNRALNAASELTAITSRSPAAAASRHSADLTPTPAPVSSSRDDENRPQRLDAT